ncbi:hypothetical protein AA309_08845 [Microvirga vignae]|uniref:Uncharacterized protein n=1 Tax=Microvirga vignae TaxID=1225564 RepID=A0A0H1RE16_9HYPH|nr:hypothetical protein [Microvirga vignae]KLK93423.1 hypothetical protein AA309_08845 [Microvirga vignae]
MILAYVVFGLVGAVAAPAVVGLMMPASALDLLACALLGANVTPFGVALVVLLRDFLANGSERKRSAADEARAVRGM